MSACYEDESHACSRSSRRICICLLCGLPGSGKTTLLQQIVSRGEGNVGNSAGQLLLRMIIFGIEYDAILKLYAHTRNETEEHELCGRWKSDRIQIVLALEAVLQHICSSSYNMVLPVKPQEVRTEVWQHFSHLVDMLNTDRQDSINELLLVVDDNMYFRSMRYEYFKLARKYQTGYCQVYVKCFTETALLRNRSREKTHQVPEEIILKMANRLEPPDPEKYSWETNSITVSSEGKIILEQIFTAIETAIKNPIQPVEIIDEEELSKCRFECSASLLHQADLILRKCVATKMAEFKTHVKPQELKEKSKCLVQVKEKVLNNLKNGQLSHILNKELDITNAAQVPDSEFFKIINDCFLIELSRY